jgi:hypothetical protein
MFQLVPSADAYVLKMILHDWNDEECVDILSNIRRASPATGQLFIAEFVVPGPTEPHFAKLFDIHMMCGKAASGPHRNTPICLPPLAGATPVRASRPRVW